MWCKVDNILYVSGKATMEVKLTNPSALQPSSAKSGDFLECVLTLQKYRRLHMLGTSHICPQMLQVQSRHNGHTHISPCRCRARRPRTCTPRCWCCSYNTPLSSRFDSDTHRSRTLHDLQKMKALKKKKRLATKTCELFITFT